MEKVLDKIFDYVAVDYMGYDKNTSKIYEKIHNDISSILDEEEFFGELAELVYYEQLNAFKSGVALAFRMFVELNIA